MQKGLCEQDEMLTNAQREEAEELKASCQLDLKKVLPLLDEASRALEQIKQEDITLIKSFTSPPCIFILTKSNFGFAHVGCYNCTRRGELGQVEVGGCPGLQ